MTAGSGLPSPAGDIPTVHDGSQAQDPRARALASPERGGEGATSTETTGFSLSPSEWARFLTPLVERLAKHPRRALASVLAHEVMMLTAAWRTRETFEAMEATLLHEVGEWSKIVRLRALSQRVQAILDGKTKPRRRRRRKVTRRTG